LRDHCVSIVLVVCAYCVIIVLLCEYHDSIV